MRVRGLWGKLRRWKKTALGNENAAASDYSYPRRQSHPLRTSFPRRQEGWHPRDAEHRTKERQYWRWSIGLTFIAVVGALVSAWFAKGALKAGRDQATAAVEGNFENNRAWVKVLGFDHFLFSIDKDLADFNGTLLVKNIGHSPAERIEAVAALVPDFGLEDPINVAVRLCGPSKHAAAQRLKEEFAYTPYAGFSLVGCVNYFIPTGRTFRHTTFVYDLNRPCAESPVGVCSFDLTHRAFYRAGDILLKKSLGGDLAN